MPMCAGAGTARNPIRQPIPRDSDGNTLIKSRPSAINQGLSVFLMSLRAQRGNLVAVAMMVPRHVLNLNEIATSLRSSQ